MMNLKDVKPILAKIVVGFIALILVSFGVWSLYLIPIKKISITTDIDLLIASFVLTIIWIVILSVIEIFGNVLAWASDQIKKQETDN